MQHRHGIAGLLGCRGLAIALVLLALLSGARGAQAGTISLMVTTRASVSGRAVRAEFDLNNAGTDTAYDVRVSASLQGQSKEAAIADSLSPEQGGEGALDLVLAKGARGTFPLLVEIEYKDSSGREFSSVSVASVRTPDAGPTQLALTVTHGYGERWSDVSVGVRGGEPGPETVSITCYCPADLTVAPKNRMVPLVSGKGVAEFKLVNRSALADSHYAVFFVAEYERDGIHYMADGAASIPVSADIAREGQPEAAPGQVGQRHVVSWNNVLVLAGILALIAVVASAANRRARDGMRLVFDEKPWGRITLDLLVILAVEWFILVRLSPACLVTPTVAAGGDTASHYYTVDYLRHVLFPSGHITGWTMGNYAGFPILQMYFPLPFLLMCGLDAVMPLEVAFKLVTLLGTFLLPIAAYLMLRSMRVPFPGPALGAACVLPFLFNEANTMWGGSILSTLAGEYSYSLSMALSLILLGSLYKGASTNKRVILNAFLVFLVGFSHGYTLLFAEAMSVFLLFVPKGFVQRLIYLGKVYALGFCFLGFWIVPLLAFTEYTTPYHVVWTIHFFAEVLPDILLPFAVAGGAGVVGLLAWGIAAFRKGGSDVLRAIAFMGFGIVVAGVMFMTAPKLGVVDIRYVPYAQLIACLLAAISLGWLGKLLGRAGLSWILLLLVVPVIMTWTSSYVVEAPAWARWNYTGFEGKPAWPRFEKINQALHGTFEAPRVVFEHSHRHNDFGSTRAFESLPLFAGRATLEGVYMQASISAPFVFYIQSQISQEKSCPFPQYAYTNMDYPAARRRLEMFNVRDLILRSARAKRAARSAPDYRHKEGFGDYELWQLTANDGKYVVPLQYEPVLFPTDSWKVDSYRWFQRDRLLDTHLVLMDNPSPEDRDRFKAQAESLEDLPRISIDTSDCRITETIGNDEIYIETNWIGKPLLVKVSYHPNWRVEGADKVYLVSPSFMLIYPDRENVRLYYGTTWPGRLGMAFTVVGLIVLFLSVPLPWKEKRTTWSLLAARCGIPENLQPKLKWDPSIKVRWTILILALVCGGAVMAVFCHHIYTHESHRLFRRSVELKDARLYDEARRGFREVMDAEPNAPIASESAYYVAITYYLEEKDEMAIAVFEDLVERFSDSHWVPEAEYHIGYCLFRMGKEQAGIVKMREVVEQFPGSSWARYAKQRLREHDALEEGER